MNLFRFIAQHPQVTQRHPSISLSIRQQFPHSEEHLPKPATSFERHFHNPFSVTFIDKVGCDIYQQYKFHFQYKTFHTAARRRRTRSLKSSLHPMKPLHLNLQFFLRDPQGRINNKLLSCRTQVSKRFNHRDLIHNGHQFSFLFATFIFTSPHRSHIGAYLLALPPPATPDIEFCSPSETRHMEDKVDTRSVC